MKRRIIATFLCLSIVAALSAVAGCSEQPSSTSSSSSTVQGAPALQPADHDGRFERGGAAKCYGCHGAGSLANPQLTGAPLIPEDHYADSSYDSKALDANREQCLTCHPVGESR